MSESGVHAHHELRAERERLREKRAATTDRDILSALDFRIAQIDRDLPAESLEKGAENKDATAEAPEADEEEALPEPPTPEEAAAAEGLVRQARVEKMRGNAKGASARLEEAARRAPGSPAVLEALGDDLVERRKVDQAVKVYKVAVGLDPKNVGLQKKHAQAVFAVAAAGSIDEQMRLHLSDAPLLTGEDRIASLPVAVMVSAIIPGGGHLVLGQTSRGAAILCTWLAFGIWLLTMWEDLVRLLTFATATNQAQPNLMVLLPLMVMMVIYVATLASLKSLGQAAARKPIDRPKPPVDLPFE